jgi:hypothetical protein
MTRQNKIDVVLECLAALQRGVQQPTIVQEEDGTYYYIPSGYLTDISYTGSRNVVTTVDFDNWGSAFDVDSATEEEMQRAAEWAADGWEWSTEI